MVAEQLGEARLVLSADTQALEAGLARARQQSEQTSQSVEQAFSKSGRALQTAANGVQYFIDAQGRARDASGKFLTLAEQQAAGIGKAWQAAAQGPASSIRSISALQERLQALRSSYETVQIGSKGFRDLQREIQRTERELQQVDKTLGATFRAQAGGFATNLLGALGIGAGIGAGAAVGGFLKGSIDQAIELETTTRKLTNALGPQGAAGALSFTKGLSDDLGLNFRSLADTFSRFTAAATAANVPLQVQRDLFAAVSKAGQSLGLSNDELNGSLLALQQVASKGTVQMEELRGQLGERLPIALAATAKGLGISTAELIKLVESGKLTAQQFFPALTKGLNELTAGAGGLETSAQTFAKFGNAWEQLQQRLGKSVLPGVTKAIQGLTAAVEGLSVVQDAKSLGFDSGLLTGTSAQGAQAVQALRDVQEQFALTDQQARNLFSQATKASGGEFNLFGLQFTDAEFAKLLDTLPKLAAAFRARNRDAIGEAKAAEAAAAAAAEAEKKRNAEAQKGLDIQLRRNQAALQIQGAQEALSAARVAPQLNDLQNERLKNQLAINQQIRDLEADRLTLQRELAKPAGIGDGKGGAQNANTILDLQNKIAQGELRILTAREQNRQAEEGSIRAQRERVLTAQLELQALRRGPGEQASATDLLAIRLANQSVADTYRDAGLSLVKNAQAAAQALRGAQESIQGVLRGGFDLLTPGLQQEQITRARAAIQPLVDRGVIRTGVDISTPERLFQVAAFAESYSKASQTLEKALLENSKATQSLSQKDWNVYVQVPEPVVFIPPAP